MVISTYRFGPGIRFYNEETPNTLYTQVRDTRTEEQIALQESLSQAKQALNDAVKQLKLYKQSIRGKYFGECKMAARRKHNLGKAIQYRSERVESIKQRLDSLLPAWKM